MRLLKQLTEQIDTYADRLSVARIDAVSSLLRAIQPSGFWGEAAGSSVFLTFDDGPSPHTTPALLEMLGEAGTKASFFLIGQEAAKYPELVKAIHKGGHAIGNHSYSHRYLPALRTRDIEFQISHTNEIISSITGVAPELFRAPFGMMDARAASCLNEHKLAPVYWTSAPEDWSIPGAERVLRRVDWKLKAGGIIVLHEGKGLGLQTVQAAKQIIYSCRDKNLVLDRVELCLTLDRQRTTAS
mgnify:CR=1 FL=1